MLELVHTHRRITSEQIYLVVSRWPLEETGGYRKERQGVLRRLRELARAGYLNHSQDQDYLHRKGALPTRHHVFEHSAKGEMELFGTPKQQAWRHDRKARDVGYREIAHQVMQTQAVLCFLHGCEHLRLDCEWFDPDAFANTFDLTHVTVTRRLKGGDERRQELPIRPDGFFRILAGDKNLHFFLEVDRSTEPTAPISDERTSIRRKLEAFDAFYRTRENLAKGIPGYNVLFVVAPRRHSEGDVSARLAAMVDLAGRITPGWDLCRFTTYEQVDLEHPEHLLTAPIWYDAQHGLSQPRPLLREASSSLMDALDHL